jgi:methylmalonyl-CoA/ethylmalonyl-CoA epimerase
MTTNLPETLRPRTFLRIDHLGIAVPSLEAFVPVYEALLGAPCEHIEEVASEKVRTAFFSLGESHFELLEATDPESVIGRFVAQRKGGIHHICIAVSDIDAALAEYTAKGVRLIDKVPRAGAKGCRVAFVHPAATGGVLVELSQAPEAV